MKRVIIGAPFGNFATSPHATSVIGPFSLSGNASSGALSSFLRCCLGVRWHRKIGLVSTPRPYNINLRSLSAMPKEGVEGRILTLHCDAPCRWDEMIVSIRLLGKKLGLAAVELQVPRSIYPADLDDLFSSSTEIRMPIIIRPPMKDIFNVVKLAYSYGHNSFHVCAPVSDPITPTAAKINRLHTIGAVRMLKDRLPDVDLIVTGWMRAPEDAEAYIEAGADSVGATWLIANPRMWFSGARDEVLGRIVVEA